MSFLVHTAPSPPTNITPTNITSRSASITWSHPTYPNGAILQYKVSLTDDQPGNASVFMTVETSYLLDMLTPDTLYFVTLTAMNSLTGERSEEISFTTLEDGECVC